MIRVAVTPRSSASRRSSTSAALARSDDSGDASASGTPSIRCTVPPTSMPAPAVRTTTSAHRDRRARQRDRRRALGHLAGIALDAEHHVGLPPPRPASSSSGCPEPRSTAPAYPVCQISASSAPRAPPARRSAQRHDVALVVELAHELVQRERPASVAAGVQEGRVRHLVQTIEQGAQAIVEVARRRSQPLLEGVKPGERLDVTLGSDRQADVGARGGRGVAVVDDDQRASRRAGRRRRESRRGCVVSGSARQTTTTCARSRISPSVAVERRAGRQRRRRAPRRCRPPRRAGRRARSPRAPPRPSRRQSRRSAAAARRAAAPRRGGRRRRGRPARLARERRRPSSGTRAANQVSATGAPRLDAHRLGGEVDD